MTTTFYWSRCPGKFIDKRTGEPLKEGLDYSPFTGDVSGWYDKLHELIEWVGDQYYPGKYPVLLLCNDSVVTLLTTAMSRFKPAINEDFYGLPVHCHIGRFVVVIDEEVRGNEILLGAMGRIEIKNFNIID